MKTWFLSHKGNVSRLIRRRRRRGPGLGVAPAFDACHHRVAGSRGPGRVPQVPEPMTLGPEANFGFAVRQRSDLGVRKPTRRTGAIRSAQLRLLLLPTLKGGTMSKLHLWAMFGLRSVPRRRLQKRYLHVETLESRALLTLSFTGAIGIAGQGVNIGAVTTDSSGDTYVTGEYTGAANFGSGVTPTSTPNGNDDAFVVKYSSTGAVLWYTEFFNDASDPMAKSTASGITYDSANSTLYVTGNFAGTVDFNNFPGSSHLSETSSFDSGNDVSDPYIVALSGSNGHATDFDDFAPTFNSNIFVDPNRVTVNPAGDSVYVTGEYDGGAITVSDNSGDSILLAGPNEGFTLKLNASNFSLSAKYRRLGRQYVEQRRWHHGRRFELWRRDDQLVGGRRLRGWRRCNPK